jgi:hypothetical protein
MSTATTPPAGIKENVLQQFGLSNKEVGLQLQINIASGGLHLNDLVLLSARQARCLPHELFSADMQALDCLFQNNTAWPLRGGLKTTCSDF